MAFVDRNGKLSRLRVEKVARDYSTWSFDDLMRLDVPDDSVFDWFRRYWSDFSNGVSEKTQMNRSAATVKNAGERFTFFMRWCAEQGLHVQSIASVKVHNINEYLALYGEKLSTKKKVRQELMQFFGWCAQDDECPLKGNPVAKTAKVMHMARPTEWLTADEIDALSDCIREASMKGSPERVHRNRLLDLAVLAFMMETASRRGGVCSVKASDVDFAKAEVTYRDKGKLCRKSIPNAVLLMQSYAKVRNFPARFRWESASDLQGRIDQWNAQHNRPESKQFQYDPRRPDDHFFRTMEGFPVTPHAVEAMARRWTFYLTAYYGEPKKVTPHMLRKSAAMMFYEASGKDIYRTRDFLGHSSVTMTEVYLGLRESERAEMVAKFSPLKNLRLVG